MLTRLDVTSGRLVVSATKPVAMMKASAAGGLKSRRIRIASTMGVSSRAAPSLANSALIIAPRTTINGNSRRPRPRPQRAMCSAAQAKKPASSRIREMMISATKVKVASQTMPQTTPTSARPTTPVPSATAAPASALQPMPSPLGCQITRVRVARKIVSASIGCPLRERVQSQPDDCQTRPKEAGIPGESDPSPSEKPAPDAAVGCGWRL